MSQPAPEPTPLGPLVPDAPDAPGAPMAPGVADAPAKRPAAPEIAPDLALSPFCIHLQSKKLFFLGHPPRTVEDVLDASRHCWCRKTMQALGPDGEVVDPRDCRGDCQAVRSCFESIL